MTLAQLAPRLPHSPVAQRTAICRVCGRDIRLTASGFGHTEAIPRTVASVRHYARPRFVPVQGIGVTPSSGALNEADTAPSSRA
jgi:hypothetical protein